jgi:hypothetical protein
MNLSDRPPHSNRVSGRADTKKSGFSPIFRSENRNLAGLSAASCDPRRACTTQKRTCLVAPPFNDRRSVAKVLTSKNRRFFC